MKLGIYLNAQHPADRDPRRCLDEIVEQVRLIRALGFDSIWGGEHHVTDGFHYFPLLSLLNRLVPEAEGLEVGTNIVLAPLHNPVELAEIAAFLDVATGGRFTLGLGLGYREEEFAIFGVSMKERVSRLTEAVTIIRRLWTEDRVTHKGRHWSLDNVTIRPQPLRKPHPPIIVASQVEPGIERAARISDGWAVIPTPRIDALAKQSRLFAETRRAAGLPESNHIVRIYETSCAESEETALSRAAPFLITKYKAYASWGLPGIEFDPALSPTEQLRRLAKDRFGVGTPTQVVEAILAQHRAGMRHLGMRVGWPGMRQDDILASIELIGRTVLPEVRRRLSAA